MIVTKPPFETLSLVNKLTISNSVSCSKAATMMTGDKLTAQVTKDSERMYLECYDWANGQNVDPL